MSDIPYTEEEKEEKINKLLEKNTLEELGLEEN